MVNVRFHESEYEEVFVQILFDAGWKYTHGPGLTERLITDTIYEPDICTYLKAKYAQRNLTEQDYGQIVSNLHNINEVNDYLTARDIHKLIYHEGCDYQPLD